MTTPPDRSRKLSLSFLLVLLGAASILPSAAAAQKVVPLPADVAKDLELLGDGVVGKALPAPQLENVIEWYMGVPQGGEWTYHVTKGEKKHLRTDTISPAPAPAPGRVGQQSWQEKIGDEFIQHMVLHPDGSLGKIGEDDLELSYGCHFHPGIFLTPGLEPGQSREVKSKALAFKAGDPDETSYTGSIDTTVTYVGAYEVTTPAGTFPTVLMRAEFDIKIGPAKVKDVQYSFYAKGVGRVAEVEGLHVSALLIYHSNDKTAKVLAEKPKLASK